MGKIGRHAPLVRDAVTTDSGRYQKEPSHDREESVDLIAWQKAMDLVEMVYRATMSFPRDEMYGLTAQVRRAAVSVPSNIAEGQARRTTADFLRFLSIACGSLAEADTQILIAERLGYLTASVRASVQTQTAEVGRLIHGLMNSLTPAPRT